LSDLCYKSEKQKLMHAKMELCSATCCGLTAVWRVDGARAASTCSKYAYSGESVSHNLHSVFLSLSNCTLSVSSIITVILQCNARHVHTCPSPCKVRVPVVTAASGLCGCGSTSHGAELAAGTVDNCTFAAAPKPFEVRAGSSLYSDDVSLQLEVRNSQFIAPTPLEDIPDPSVFLSRDDKWFAELRNVRPCQMCVPKARQALHVLRCSVLLSAHVHACTHAWLILREQNTLMSNERERESSVDFFWLAGILRDISNDPICDSANAAGTPKRPY
jgi:hypothetical protein